MGFLLPQKAPAPPPPPPEPPTLAQPSIAEAGANERQRLASAEGAGFDSTDVTGGKSPNPTTTASAPKSLLGS